MKHATHVTFKIMPYINIFMLTEGKTSASAGLQDAYPTIQPYAMPPPPIPNAQRPWPQLGNTPDASETASPTYAAAPVTPCEPVFTKGEKTCLDSRPTCMQNFTPLAFSAAEKSMTCKKTNTQ